MSHADGEIFAMSGGTFAHGALAGTVDAQLSSLGCSLEVDRLCSGLLDAGAEQAHEP